MRESFGQHFDSDFAAQLRVARPVKLSHPTCPKGRQDLVLAEAGPSGKGHKGCAIIDRAAKESKRIPRPRSGGARL